MRQPQCRNACHHCSNVSMKARSENEVVALPQMQGPLWYIKELLIMLGNIVEVFAGLDTILVQCCTHWLRQPYLIEFVDELFFLDASTGYAILGRIPLANEIYIFPHQEIQKRIKSETRSDRCSGTASPLPMRPSCIAVHGCSKVYRLTANNHDIVHAVLATKISGEFSSHGNLLRSISQDLQ